MKPLAFATALLLAAPYGVAPAVAQSRLDSQQQCESALAAAEDLLINGRNLWITSINTHSIEERYVNFPYQAPVGLSIGFDGDDASDMMFSPRLLTSITQTIMNGCPRVGFVTYGVAETDWVIAFGLIGNQVQEFQCIDPDGYSSLTQWGYYACL